MEASFGLRLLWISIWQPGSDLLCFWWYIVVSDSECLAPISYYFVELLGVQVIQQRKVSRCEKNTEKTWMEWIAIIIGGWNRTDQAAFKTRQTLRVSCCHKIYDFCVRFQESGIRNKHCFLNLTLANYEALKYSRPGSFTLKSAYICAREKQSKNKAVKICLAT